VVDECVREVSVAMAERRDSPSSATAPWLASGAGAACVRVEHAEAKL